MAVQAVAGQPKPVYVEDMQEAWLKEWVKPE